jgi:hypothetical protein
MMAAAYLFGPMPEVAAFSTLARRAWPLLPLGAGSFITSGNEDDHWMRFVYAALRQEFPSFFWMDKVLQVVAGPEEGELIYSFNAEQEAHADGERWAGCPRFRITSLRVDPFTASSAAIDAITSERLVRSILDSDAGRPISAPSAQASESTTAFPQLAPSQARKQRAADRNAYIHAILAARKEDPMEVAEERWSEIHAGIKKDESSQHLLYRNKHSKKFTTVASMKEHFLDHFRSTRIREN